MACCLHIRQNFGDYIDFYGGIDFRYYKGTHTNELSDLYGGKYFLDESREKVKAVNNALAGTPEYVKKNYRWEMWYIVIMMAMLCQKEYLHKLSTIKIN